MNVGLMLGDPSNRLWRVQRYVELWVLFQSDVMVDHGDDMLHVGMMCRQGKHRSVVWMLLELRIFQACGMACSYHNTCKWMQQKEHCQASCFPGACSECGSVREERPTFPDDSLTQAVLNEFFDTVLVLESRV